MVPNNTARLQFRQLTLSDIGNLCTIFCDADTMLYYPAPYTNKQVETFICKMIKSYTDNGFGLWALIRKHDQQFLGDCGITMQNIDGDVVPEIGYHIHKNYWKQRYATEAAQVCLPYGFDTLHFDELFIHTFVKNKPSLRVAEKLGMMFVKEYEKYIESNDIVMRHVVYSIKKEQFDNLASR
ncbi:GNAT family N-acetyltransferase [candidate division KSB1 bacterium]|nr:GNAT family N-acetyltransferase [candidate division KSB1 bacterium]